MSPTFEGERGRRLHISHRSGYRYATQVDASFNEVRMTPENREGQFLLSHHLHVTPNAAVQSYTDYWGAFVESFDVHVPHDMLEVVAVSTVDTPASRTPDKRSDWAGVLSHAVHDRWGEYLGFSGYVDDPRLDGARAELASVLRREPSPRAAAEAGVAAVRDRIAYTPGVTSVSTTPSIRSSDVGRRRCCRWPSATT